MDYYGLRTRKKVLAFRFCTFSWQNIMQVGWLAACTFFFLTNRRDEPLCAYHHLWLVKRLRQLYRFTLSYIKKIVRQTSWVAKAGGRYMGKSQSTWFGIMVWLAKSTQRFVYDSGTRALWAVCIDKVVKSSQCVMVSGNNSVNTKMCASEKE